MNQWYLSAIFSVLVFEPPPNQMWAAVLNQIPDLIQQHYVLTEKRDQFANAFRAKLRQQAYSGIQDPLLLAARVSVDLKDLAADKHLYLQYSDPDKQPKNEDWSAWEQAERELERRQNFGFTLVEVLEGNIGYLRVVEFMHPRRGLPTAVAAMQLVAHTDGLIVDVRGNGGGYPGLMHYLMNHYFAGPPTHLSTTYYSDPAQLPDKIYSSDLVHGALRNTPLYILVDGETGSAAEYFAYTLQAFGKAKVVGQRTAGAAHMNSYFDLGNRFRLSISTAAPINPLTGSNWEQSGVKPDLVVTTDRAKDRALHALQQELRIPANQPMTGPLE